MKSFIFIGRNKIKKARFDYLKAETLGFFLPTIQLYIMENVVHASWWVVEDENAFSCSPNSRPTKVLFVSLCCTFLSRELVRAGNDFWENLRVEDQERESEGKKWVNEK